MEAVEITKYGNRGSTPTIDKGFRIARIIAALLLGAAFAICTIAATTATAVFTSRFLYLLWAIFSVVFYVLFCLLLHAINFLSRPYNMGTRSWGPYGLNTSRMATLRNAVVIFIAWVPYPLLAGGLMAWDTGDQVATYYGVSFFGFPSGTIWAHHPPATTFLYGKFASLGMRLFGSYYTGFTLLAVIQIALASIAIALLLREFLKSKSATLGARILLIFLTFFPIFPIVFSTIVKDSTNLVVFLWWILLYLKLMQSKFELTKEPLFDVTFIVISLSCFLTKKTSIYVIVLSLLIALILVRPKALYTVLAALIVGASVIIQTVVIEGILYPQLGVVESDSQSAYTPIIQMICRAGYEYPSILNESEQAVFNENVTGVDWDELPERYIPFTTDPCLWSPLYVGEGPVSVENQFSLSEFAPLVAKLFLRCPGAMLRGYICLESGWFSFVSAGTLGWPEDTTTDPLTMQPYFFSGGNEYSWGQITAAARVTEGGNLLKQIYTVVSNIPGINILFYNSVWVSILPTFLFIWTLRKSNRKLKFALVLPILLSAAVLLLSPVSVQLIGGSPSPTRYVMTLVMLVTISPCLLSDCSSKVNNEIQETSNFALMKRQCPK